MNESDLTRLLIVEDEVSLAGPIIRGLKEEGYFVDLAQDGLEGEAMALSGSYDMFIIDWRLPRIDGRTLVERIRRHGFREPILMLTALRDLDHKIAGLDAGADDYMTKPFSFEELLARLRALRRRPILASSTNVQSVRLQAGNLAMDTARRRVTAGEKTLELRTKEYQLLELLLRKQSQVVSRSMIAERVWGSMHDVTDNAIDVTVSGLRQKLAASIDPAGTVTVETIRGVGYTLRVPDDDDSPNQLDAS